MRRIAIVGSGIAGLVAAHGLLKAGYDVTLFSDRTSSQWLHESRPTGTAARFDMALEYERELGLNHWDEVAPLGRGVHLTFCPKVGNRLVTLTGRLERPFMAVDVRLQSHRWMLDFEARGGRLVIETVGVPRLEQIAEAFDLTVVAVGRADLCQLFARDGQRSVYDQPQRNLAMVLTRGGPMGFEGVPFLPVKFNLFAPVGEAFWVPYYHPTEGSSWCLLFEAKPGGPMDRFGGARSGEEVLRLGKEVIRTLIPWDWPWVKDQELADPNGWLVGRITPTVRDPVGRLPSGRIVAGLGDTAMSLDPIGGQGANNGSKMVRNFVECVVAHEDRPFDADWVRATFEQFYARHGHRIYTFNNLLLEPLTAPGRELLLAQYGSDGLGHSGRQAIADAFITNFNDPTTLTPSFLSSRVARETIREKTGGSWLWPVASGAARVARAQVRQALGLPPNHPLADVPAPIAPERRQAS